MSIPAIPKDYYGHKTELFLDNLCNQESDNLRDHKHYFLKDSKRRELSRKCRDIVFICIHQDKLLINDKYLLTIVKCA